MAVSGTYDFNLDIDQVIQEASEMIGGESTLGHEPESARRSINKTQTGKPNQYSIRRGRDNPVLSVWPLPENSTDVIKLELVKELQDVNKSAIQNADLPKRFLPCLTMGLAYYMSLKRPLVQADRIALLKTNYEEMLNRALLEDRETSSIYILPRITFYN
jgi:hypothetical protein